MKTFILAAILVALAVIGVPPVHASPSTQTTIELIAPPPDVPTLTDSCVWDLGNVVQQEVVPTKTAAIVILDTNWTYAFLYGTPYQSAADSPGGTLAILDANAMHYGNTCGLINGPPLTDAVASSRPPAWPPSPRRHRQTSPDRETTPSSPYAIRRANPGG